MQLAGTAAVVAGEAVIGQVVVTGPLGHVDVPGDAQLGVTVERARRDADRLAPRRVPEQARAALATEPAPRVGIAGGAVDPPHRAPVVDGEIVATSRRERGDVAVPPPALFAVADQDVLQRPAHLVADRSAKASPGRHHCAAG